MSIFRNRLFMATGLGHTLLDIFNSSGPVLVAFLSAQLGWSNTMIALAIGLYQTMGAISQPFFGWLADRYGGRWQLGLGVTWTIGFLVLAIFAAQSGDFYLFLVPFVLASFGSAAFHPIGAKYAAITATRQAATATAFFFLFGQFGLGTGPLLTGAILDRFGLIGLPVLALFAIPILLFILTTAGPKGEVKPAVPQSKSSPDIVRAERRVIPWGPIGILVIHTFCRSWAQNGTVSFIPKLFQDKGWDPTTYGALLSTMWVASAIAGVLAGNAADRWGRRQVVFVVMILAAAPLYFLPITDVTTSAFILALLVGGLTGAPHSITVVIAQAMLPGKQATASGLILGLIFGMGALATFAIGGLADLWTLEQAMQVGAGMSLLAGVSALALPKTRAPEPLPEVELVEA
jgi:FSR family fosmidomycin resistance protein-like MFS transporter